jgi:hypothetical protein
LLRKLKQDVPRQRVSIPGEATALFSFGFVIGHGLQNRPARQALRKDESRRVVERTATALGNGTQSGQSVAGPSE